MKNLNLLSLILLLSIAAPIVAMETGAPIDPIERIFNILKSNEETPQQKYEQINDFLASHKGINLNIINLNLEDIRFGMTPLMYATQAGRPDARIVKALLAAGAKPNIQSKSEGYTALMIIASNIHASPAEKKEIIKELINAGARKDLKDWHGKTAADTARALGFNDIAEMLE